MANGNGNGNGRGKGRKRFAFVSAGVVLLAVFGLMAARRGGKEIDPSRLAAIEKGDLARSVVATGKVQPLTKVEIKSRSWPSSTASSWKPPSGRRGRTSCRRRRPGSGTRSRPRGPTCPS
jgi:hypothetical protein